MSNLINRVEPLQPAPSHWPSLASGGGFSVYVNMYTDVFVRSACVHACGKKEEGVGQDGSGYYVPCEVAVGACSCHAVHLRVSLT